MASMVLAGICASVAVRLSCNCCHKSAQLGALGEMLTSAMGSCRPLVEASRRAVRRASS